MSDLEKRLDEHGARLTKVEQHVAVLMDAKEKTEQDIDQIERNQSEAQKRHEELRVYLEREIGDLKTDVAVVLPKVAESIPKEVQVEYDKRLKRTHYKWVIASAVLTVVALLSSHFHLMVK
jgi:predicted  nucleic acid-binding Zn-ribbon protein